MHPKSNFSYTVPCCFQKGSSRLKPVFLKILIRRLSRIPFKTSETFCDADISRPGNLFQSNPVSVIFMDKVQKLLDTLMIFLKNFRKYSVWVSAVTISEGFSAAIKDVYKRQL